MRNVLPLFGTQTASHTTGLGMQNQAKAEANLVTHLSNTSRWGIYSAIVAATAFWTLVGRASDEVVEDDSAVAADDDLRPYLNPFTEWKPTLGRVWMSATAWHSALRWGPSWSDVASTCNTLVSQQPKIELPTVEQVLPAAKVVKDVVNQEDIAVPSNVMYVRFSKPFLERYFCKSIDERSPVRDTMLGASVVGTRHTVAGTELTLLQSSQQAQARLRFSGNNYFTTTASKDRVQVHSRGTTDFSAETTIRFDGEKARHTPIVSRATTRTRTTGMTTSYPGLRRRIALRIAADEEASTHAQAERITSQRTEERVTKGFEARMSAGLEMFTQELREQYAKLPFEGRFALKEVRANTTPQVLEIVLIGRGEEAPNFADAPAFLQGDPDIEFQIHTSLIQKAILEPELRKTLQAAVTGLVDRPLMTLVAAARDSRREDPQRELKIHWLEGRGEWLALAWHAKENEPPPIKSKARSGDRVTVRVRP